MAKSLQEEAQKTKIFYYYEKELQMHDYSNVNQFKRKICKGSLEIFLFMQITDFLADLCCILAVFTVKPIKP